MPEYWKQVFKLKSLLRAEFKAASMVSPKIELEIKEALEQQELFTKVYSQLNGYHNKNEI